MRRTRIKFCGMTRLDDVRCAVDLGVDAIGMIFVPGSKRAIDLPLAARLVQAIPPLVTRVALFLNPEAAAVQAVLREVPVDLLQFHGSESPDFCASFERPYVKALAMGDDVDVGFEMSRYARARGVLLDAHRSGEQGGRGEAFDWSRIPAQWAPRILLAGLAAGYRGPCHPYCAALCRRCVQWYRVGARREVGASHAAFRSRGGTCKPRIRASVRASITQPTQMPADILGPMAAAL